MSKYKKGDRVIVKFRNDIIWCGEVTFLDTDLVDRVVYGVRLYSGVVHTVYEDYISLDIQYYREKRLNKLLDE